jgi:DNA-binding LacI/PurR family transcriptional regulator
VAKQVGVSQATGSSASVEGLGFPRVCADEEHAVDLARSHLAALGHERIGLILGSADRVPSLRKLAPHRGARGTDFVAHAHLTMEEGQAAATGLIDAGATAPICASFASSPNSSSAHQQHPTSGVSAHSVQ